MPKLTVKSEVTSYAFKVNSGFQEVVLVRLFTTQCTLRGELETVSKNKVTLPGNTVSGTRVLQMHFNGGRPPLEFFSNSNDDLDIMTISLKRAALDLCDVKQLVHTKAGNWVPREPARLYKSSAVDMFKDITDSELQNLLVLFNRYRNYLPNLVKADKGKILSQIEII